MSHQAVVAVLLAELIDEVKGLRADLAETVWHMHMPHGESQIRSPLTRADRLQLGRLLPVVAGVFGSEPFLSRDLFEHDSAALRLVCRGRNARRLGRLFQRAAGQVVDGLMVERAGVELGAILWRCVGVPGSPLPAVPPPPPRGLA